MTLSPRISRLLALSLAVAFALAVVLLMLAPLARYYQAQWFQAQLLGRQVQRYQAVLANEQQLSGQLAAIGDRLAAENLLIPGDNPAIAAANLREHVNRAIERAGAQVISAQDIEAKALAGLFAVGLRVQVNGEIDQFVSLLTQLEQVEPYTLVTSLDISSTLARGSLQSSADSGRSLFMTLDLAAYGSGGEQ